MSPICFFIAGGSAMIVTDMPKRLLGTASKNTEARSLHSLNSSPFYTALGKSSCAFLVFYCQGLGQNWAAFMAIWQLRINIVMHRL